jgi:hypothetical protein
MTVQEFVNIDKDLQTVQDISDVNIIIQIYFFINHVLSNAITRKENTGNYSNQNN